MRVAQRRGMRRAIVAVARRLAVVLHRMWVDGSEFRWSKDSTAVPRLPEAAAKNAGKTAVKEINAFCFGRKMSSRGRRMG